MHSGFLRHIELRRNDVSGILALGPDGIQEAKYTDTEHYAVTRAFLQNPERMLRDIFGAIDEG
jgi:predicted ATPase